MTDERDGYGDGYGYGYGYGSGDGYGYGYGSGYGYGYGSGSGYGEPIGRAGDHVVAVLAPWPYVRVGCEIHSLEYWKDHWREIAAKHGLNVTEGEVAIELAVAARLLKNSLTATSLHGQEVP
jgi:hypothetical protein